MKNHVLRPLWLAILLVAVILLARYVVVPSDFGVNGNSFTYNFFRKGSINDWKAFKVKYHGRKYCVECHSEKVDEITTSPHGIIQCENCHGPAVNHPDDPKRLPIDRSRNLCLRCHSELGYAGTNRSTIPGIDPKEHNVDTQCVECHNPHNPDLEEM